KRLLFLSYNKSRYEDMSKALVKFKHDAESLLFHYEQALNTCLARLPRIKYLKEMLLEIFSYFSQELKQEEIEFFESRLKLFEEERLPLSAMLTLLKAYILRFSEESLLSQSYFAPYPESLMTLHDSKK
ncbi:MAG: YbgA family protein, partial [Clostridia bacterium]|nr:YbgA family protein [Clostridia bacterium]